MKITFKGKAWLDRKGVMDAVQEAKIQPIKKAALLVETEMKRSMKSGGGKDGTPSPEGSPPHVQTGTLRGSIRSAPTPEGTYLVGCSGEGWYGRVHEFGTIIQVTAKMRAFLHTKGIHLPASKEVVRIPERPFARPALQTVKDKFAKLFTDIELAKTRAGRRLNSRKGKKGK